MHHVKTVRYLRCWRCAAVSVFAVLSCGAERGESGNSTGQSHGAGTSSPVSDATPSEGVGGSGASTSAAIDDDVVTAEDECDGECPSNSACTNGLCTCIAGLTLCNNNGSSFCADLMTDFLNCGGCGRSCPVDCFGGACNVP